MVICNSVKIQHWFFFQENGEDECILVLDDEDCSGMWIEVRDEDRIEFRIRFVVEFMEVRDSHTLISMIYVQIPIIKIHYFFTLYLWRSWSWGLIILKHGHWVVGKWFCLFSSIVGVSFIFYLKSKPCTSRLSGWLMYSRFYFYFLL